MKNLYKKIKINGGMTYVELIVVLVIFAIMTSIVIFNYGNFQAKIDIKNLASDVALQIVQAQKSSLSGQLPPISQRGQIESLWKPSYGIYFDLTQATGDNKSFIYFTDLNDVLNDPQTQDGTYNASSCPGTGECLSKISITKGNFISGLKLFGTGCPAGSSKLIILFKRPDSSAQISTSPPTGCSISYAQITISTPKAVTSLIKVYPSGRIQIN